MLKYLLIIRHFDTSTTFSFKLEDLNDKEDTIKCFPNLNYNLLLTKTKEK